MNRYAILLLLNPRPTADPCQVYAASALLQPATSSYDC